MPSPRAKARAKPATPTSAPAPKPKSKGGRPKFEPTDAHRNLVRVGAAHRVPLDILAMMCETTVPTLRKYLRAELKHGWEYTKARVIISLTRKAISGDVPAARYWLSCHGGPEWRATSNALLGGIDGGAPIPLSNDGAVVVLLPSNGRDQKPADAKAPGA